MKENNNFYFESEDEKYGGLEVDNWVEEMEYARLNEQGVTKKDIRPRTTSEVGSGEASYHNTYYHGKGKYGTRTIKMNNKKWHELNKTSG